MPQQHSAKQTALAFVAAINFHDLDALVSLLSDDHTFIDAFGEPWQGRATLRRAWSGYLDWFPDYKITVKETLVQGNTVVMLGTASGTYAVAGQLPPENYWEIPAAWKVVASSGLVTHWQVYADNQPVRDIMSVDED
ncbi:MAG: nuclear transport factor 2 family protein [Chloroflexota bacterium]